MRDDGKVAAVRFIDDGLHLIERHLILIDQLDHIDAAVGELVRVVRGGGRVVRVTASGGIAAGAEVQVGANGTAATKAAGVAVGYAITGAADAADAEISLH